MPIFDNLKVGLEIHQQLATGKKLFCNCKPIETDEYSIKFQRQLRSAKGELGGHDPASMFEASKSMSIIYYAEPSSSCLVEYDEEPPHRLDSDAKRIALVIASALESKVFGETYSMRKTVIDGSNTTGFQRTILLSEGGSFRVGPKTIGIQSICLEEDAAKNLGGQGTVRKFGLERLGIPLVEIATEPFSADPADIKEIALTLGRILRSTKNVRRGLGSIRQDVNVSIIDKTVIEVKGVQQLDQLATVVEYEAKRQDGILKISERLKTKAWSCQKKDITELFAGCKSKIIQDAIKKGHQICAVSFGGLRGMFGYSPFDGIRLGKDIAELVRFFGIGGIFHSDELPNYKIEQLDIQGLAEFMGLGDDDGFLILACPRQKAEMVIDQIVGRIRYIRDHGIPVDTRLATQEGQTRFLRPRPGAARMYPETDIMPVITTKAELEQAQGDVPIPWDESLRQLRGRGLNQQLAEQLFDSRYSELFEEIIRLDVNPTFVASVLCSTITNLERSGLDSGLLGDKVILEAFELLACGKVAKESIEMIFADIMSGKSDSVQQAIEAASIQNMSESDLEGIIKGIVQKNAGLVRNQKQRAIGPLMGIAMKELRGKASGQAVNMLLERHISEMVREVGFEPTNS